MAQAIIHTCDSEQGIAGLRPAWASRTEPHEVNKEITWRVRADRCLKTSTNVHLATGNKQQTPFLVRDTIASGWYKF